MPSFVAQAAGLLSILLIRDMEVCNAHPRLHEHIMQVFPARLPHESLFCTFLVLLVKHDFDTLPRGPCHATAGLDAPIAWILRNAKGPYLSSVTPVQTSNAVA